MRKGLLLVPAVILIWGITLVVAAQQQPAPTETQQQGVLSDTEKEFMSKAAEGNLFEVKAGKLAQDSATNSSVKQFGEKMVNDHSTANQELQELARMKGVQLPQQVQREKQNLYDQLANAAREDFDKTYMDLMVRDHQEDVANFQKQQAQTTDPELKAWITKTLPVLRDHLQQAQLINQELNAGQPE
ncbi:MAG: DUF4142 domain-containing protein [Candidatus Abyssobacteria bacterium SURF_5]|uniref:DUF4142 domain-containing protein n=1 Tax=Abyssobacteria bacterium (strain SURF_5) TaxID=2093360 RepID=A0A3A4N8I1_ABYX5|nr:MAG: DUF4142 domain-containing protein [Candidatus Abyssubacteria bacterium SURF_5]